MDPIQRILDSLARATNSATDRGDVCQAIPALSCVDPHKFGIAVAFPSGQVCVAGDADEAFSIQSISKVFTLTLALGRVGDSLWQRVGREPSGSPFNSIVQLERDRGIPRNPFINAGAIVTTDIVLGRREPREAIGEILRFAQSLADDTTIRIDEKVALSESSTGFRNAALANYARSFGNLENAVDRVLGVYFHQCAIAMSCRQLARAGLFLACDGQVPQLNQSVVSKQRAKRIKALMLTCGHYDSSGDFAFRVGLPAKSGVGGGILAIAPAKASICVWSPGLTPQGNSKLGAVSLERLVEETKWNIF